MIVVRLNGGLGNQLFQYATGRHLAHLNNSELFCRSCRRSLLSCRLSRLCISSSSRKATRGMSSRLSTAPTVNAPASNAVWSESKNVSTVRGVFSTMLGDTAALQPSIFNGQDLWLGMTVNGEELAPRQQAQYVPFARG